MFCFNGFLHLLNLGIQFLDRLTQLADLLVFQSFGIQGTLLCSSHPSFNLLQALSFLSHFPLELLCPIFNISHSISQQRYISIPVSDLLLQILDGGISLRQGCILLQYGCVPRLNNASALGCTGGSGKK